MKISTNHPLRKGGFALALLAAGMFTLNACGDGGHDHEDHADDAADHIENAADHAEEIVEDVVETVVRDDSRGSHRLGIHGMTSAP